MISLFHRLRRHSVLTALQLMLIALLVSASLALGYYVHDTLERLQQGLPAELLRQTNDLLVVVEALQRLGQAAEQALLEPDDPVHRQRLLADNQDLLDRLKALRTSYMFDNLAGASALHALVNPAAEDIQRWLHHGLPGSAADSPAVLRLVNTRARDVYARTRELSLRAHRSAIGLLEQEVSRLQRFRASLPWLQLFLFGLTLVVVGLFVSQRRGEARLAALREQLADAVESIPEGFILTDAEDRVVMCNTQYRRLYPELGALARPGVPYEQLLRHYLAHAPVLGSEGREEETIAARLARHRNPGPPSELELRDGRRIRVNEQRTRNGGIVGIHADISDLRQVQERLQHLATHDALTGLPNRAYCLERLEQALARARRHGSRFAVLFLDLDRFKLVNDTLGHHAGDELLQQVAARLQQQLRGEDTLARLGGDEFMIILEDQPPESSAVTFCQRLIQALGEPFRVTGQEVIVTSSIGIAYHPEHGSDVHSLMRHADAASYQAKAQGPNQFQVYNGASGALQLQRLRLEQDLRLALERNELRLHYQPRYSVDGVRMTGVEALLRWHHPQLGLLGPATFLELAEESGLIVAIGTWVLAQALRDYSQWRSRGLAPPRLALNLSVRQLGQTQLPAQFQQTLERYAVSADSLELELNEISQLEPPQPAFQVLQQLAAAGMHLSLDDFGTGYSSLRLLQCLPLESVKIDRAFIGQLDGPGNGRAIVGALLDLGRAMKLRMVAEGVETAAQLRWLGEQGCSEVQGNLLCPPLPAAELEVRLGGPPPRQVRAELLLR
ncbi:MAG TPA: EAL domain-containing protein [Candidatus Competibacteraceae bacterium]|nr:EAL domain-containing protein [Candidatus Competibacteraceae bacterium]